MPRPQPPSEADWDEARRRRVAVQSERNRIEAADTHARRLLGALWEAQEHWDSLLPDSSLKSSHIAAFAVLVGQAAKEVEEAFFRATGGYLR